MTIYDDLKGVASGLFKEFRQGDVFLVVTSYAASQNGTPWQPGTETTTRYALDATVSAVKSRLVDGTRITADDMTVRFAPVDGVVPKLTDRINVKGRDREIKLITAKPASGTVVAYELVVQG